MIGKRTWSGSRSRYRDVRELMGAFDHRADVKRNLYAVYLLGLAALAYLPSVGSVVAHYLGVAIPVEDVAKGTIVVVPLLAAGACWVGAGSGAIRVVAPEATFLMSGQFPPRYVLRPQVAVMVIGSAVVGVAGGVAIAYGTGWSGTNMTIAGVLGAGSLCMITSAVVVSSVPVLRRLVPLGCLVVAALGAGWLWMGWSVALLPVALGILVIAGVAVVLINGTLLDLVDIDGAVAATNRRQRLEAALMLGEQRQVRKMFETSHMFFRRFWMHPRHSAFVMIRRDMQGWIRDFPLWLLTVVVVVVVLVYSGANRAFGPVSLVGGLVAYSLIGRWFNGVQGHVDNAGLANIWPWSYRDVFKRHLIAPILLAIVVCFGSLGISAAMGATLGEMVATIVMFALVVVTRVWTLTSPTAPKEAFLSTPGQGGAFSMILFWYLRGWLVVGASILVAAAASSTWFHTTMGGVLILGLAAVIVGALIPGHLKKLLGEETSFEIAKREADEAKAAKQKAKEKARGR